MIVINPTTEKVEIEDFKKTSPFDVLRDNTKIQDCDHFSLDNYLLGVIEDNTAYMPTDDKIKRGSWRLENFSYDIIGITIISKGAPKTGDTIDVTEKDLSMFKNIIWNGTLD